MYNSSYRGMNAHITINANKDKKKGTIIIINKFSNNLYFVTSCYVFKGFIPTI